jgi:hypothetical protein
MKSPRGFAASNASAMARFRSFFLLKGPLFILIAYSFLSGSCCSLKQDMTVSELRAKYHCVEVTQGLEWKTVQEVLKEPDAAPRPGPGSLKENARAYCDKVVIFYTDLQEREVEGRKAFVEVVTKVEVCKEK